MPAEPKVPSSWPEAISAALERVREAGRWRSPVTLDGRGPTHRLPDGTEVTSFASNDYLGLRTHPDVIEAAVEAVRRWGTGSGASRLIVGSRPPHEALERALAQWRDCEAAVLFPTGYAANTGLLSALAGPGVTIFSDELNHASLIDGCRLAAARGATVRVYPHNDTETLGEWLGETSGRSIVVTDAVFSMDGDVADVAELSRLCAGHGSLLVLDEAHSVLGPEVPTGPGAPLTARVGTTSKALGSLGGFVAGPRMLADLLVNTARPYIFTTAPTPADTSAAAAALDLYRSPEGERRRRRLADLVERLAPGHPSPILPVLVGAEDAAVKASEELISRGLLVTAIRPPTVPEGTSRLRVALSSEHSEADLDRLAAALADLGLAVEGAGR